MAKQNRKNEKMDELLKLFERIDNSDVEDSGMFNFSIIVPYTGGRRSDPARWKDTSLKHRLP